MKLKLTKADKEAIYGLKDLLDKDFRNHFSIAQLAARMHLNEQKLKAGFKQLTGHTVLAYITRVRIGYAIQLLEDEDRSIKEVAYICGYGDTSVFYRNFKKITHKSPSEWRKSA